MTYLELYEGIGLLLPITPNLDITLPKSDECAVDGDLELIICSLV